MSESQAREVGEWILAHQATSPPELDKREASEGPIVKQLVSARVTAAVDAHNLERFKPIEADIDFLVSISMSPSSWLEYDPVVETPSFSFSSVPVEEQSVLASASLLSIFLYAGQFP